MIRSLVRTMRKGVPVQLAVVYLRRDGRIYVQGHVETATLRIVNRIWALNPGVGRDEIGSVVLLALNQHIRHPELRPQPADYARKERELLEAAGVESVAAFNRGTKCVFVEREHDGIRAVRVPITQGGTAPEVVIAVDDETPTALGSAVREALAA